MLSAMDQQKQLAVKQVLERIPMEGKSLTEKFEFMTREIEKLDDEIRKCYDEEIAWDKATLATMVAMDACFIFEFFDLSHQITARSDIMNDIMKLQNQIPLSVIKAILKLRFQSDDVVVDNLSWPLIGNITKLPFSSEILPWPSLKSYITEKNPFHLLDLQRMVLVDLLTPNNESKMVPTDSTNDFIPSAKLLREAGIKFKNRPIGFESGKFSLPKLIVDDSKEILLRNLMAYEECQRYSTSLYDPVISHFVCLLDDLIESEEDVGVLKKEGIIEHLLGSDKEVADIINQLCKGITDYKKSNFHSAILLAKRYYDSPCKKRIRRVREAHCKKPLYWVSFLAATAILVMTAVQMVYAIKNG